MWVGSHENATQNVIKEINQKRLLFERGKGKELNYLGAALNLASL